MEYYTDEEQKRIFAKNLNHYLEYNGLQQKELADILGEKRTTVNTWCVGKSLPRLNKVQRMADYFGIGKSDLLNDHEFTEEKEKLQLELISLFNALDDTEQEVILTTMRSLIARKSSNDKV